MGRKQKKRNLEEIYERRKKFKEDNAAYFAREAEKKKMQEEDFNMWKKNNGLDGESYDEQKHGYKDHGCDDEVLRVLFHADYVRPIDFNSKDRYFSIAIIPKNTVDEWRCGQHIHVRCDMLNGAQFDHLSALKLGINDDECRERAEKRVELWFFCASDLSIEYADVDPSISHCNEIEFLKDKDVSDDDKNRPAVIYGVLNEQAPTCTVEAGFSVMIQSRI